MEDDEIIVGINVKDNSNKKNTKSKKKDSRKKNIKNKKSKKKIISKKNKIKRTITISIVIIILIIIFLLSGLFNLKNIEILGNEQISDEAIISLSGLELYENLFRFNKSNIENNIKENAYIESVEVSRKLPNTVEITIKERKVKYMLEYANSYAYINNQGYILEITNEKLEIPSIIGYSTDLSVTKAGERMDIEDLRKLDTVIKIFETAKSNDIGNLVTKIDISNDKNYAIILASEGKTVYLGECTDLNTRILYLKSILEKTKGKNGEIFLNMDLNSDDAYFRPSTN